MPKPQNQIKTRSVVTPAVANVADVLSLPQLADTANNIAAQQLPNGMIPWLPDGHADPWNHVEAAMALSVMGHQTQAERAYQWLLNRQRPDGAWHQYYLADQVEQDKLDANCVAYIGTGVWHHYLCTRNRSFLESMWPAIQKAMGFVLDLQLPRGEIRWARHADGTPWSFALLTGSSSIYHSLRSAIAIAKELGHERPDWELSTARLANVIRTQPDAFAPKDRWAMDWYYPVLSGVITGQEGRARLASQFDQFVMDGLGVRCVSDRPWVTTAETCESVIAHLSVGQRDIAVEMFKWVQNLRANDGSYFTGMVYPEQVHFPANERTTYTAAAVILAADALLGISPASTLFSNHHTLPKLITIG
ncbi:MAG: prenyltransferase [Acidimicrobiia bacterium]|nr:prenyltransferase [Acidimicrobiia bacterium]MYC57715.1 prenyltransferase [Acidimicrobiia bacterium]MYG94622.1 prenyltransferase [Acidimicrobiia bacterium]MYI30914.1 prenyltransferase [Acidimicrobiia bacterium]